jgi:predicted NBD/HSP70 family sugar kinase
MSVTPSHDKTSQRRRRSRDQLLTLIRDRDAVTRSELSGLTGLSRSAVADGVQSLLADRLIVEDRSGSGGTDSGPGRPAAMLCPARPEGVVVGIDFGHSHVAVAVAETTGRVIGEHRKLMDVDGAAGPALDTAGRLVYQLLGDLGIPLAAVLDIAAGIPGPLDLHTRVLRSPSILADWVGLAPAEELAARIGRAVHVANDADMGAQGELRFGAARGCRDFLYVKASHGIGAGLVLNGQTYRGAGGIAGEIGHTQLPGAANWCRCGNRGCLETVVCIGEVHRQLAETRLELAPNNLDLSLAEISINPVAARVITEAGRTIGRVLADLCNGLNPGVIILGGELGTAGQPLISGVRESIDRYAQPATAEAVDIRTAALGLRSELIGAVCLAIQHAGNGS